MLRTNLHRQALEVQNRIMHFARIHTMIGLSDAIFFEKLVLVYTCHCPFSYHVDRKST